MPSYQKTGIQDRAVGKGARIKKKKNLKSGSFLAKQGAIMLTSEEEQRDVTVWKQAVFCW